MGGKLVAEEHREAGGGSTKFYLMYWREGYGIGWLFLAALIMGFSFALLTVSRFILIGWANQTEVYLYWADYYGVPGNHTEPEWDWTAINVGPGEFPPVLAAE